MLQNAYGATSFATWFALCLAGCIAITCLPLTFSGADYCAIFYVVLTMPLVGFFLLLLFKRSRGKQRAASSLVATAFVGFTALFTTHFLEVRDAFRWFLVGRAAAAEILAQPSPTPGQARHSEWEAWGAPGAGDTTVYLVFDPSDSLATVAKSKASGKFGVLPCEVYRVRRLEKSWYAVQFYTETTWDDC